MLLNQNISGSFGLLGAVIEVLSGGLGYLGSYIENNNTKKTIKLNLIITILLGVYYASLL